MLLHFSSLIPKLAWSCAGILLASMALALDARSAPDSHRPNRQQGDATSQGGLKAEYFDNRDLKGPARLTRVDPQVDFDWGFHPPAPSVPYDRFSIRWTGQLQPRFSEAYAFTGYHDDGLRIWIDDKLVYDKWNTNEGNYSSTPLMLKADQRYNLRIEYFDNDRHARVVVKWKSLSQPEETVPASNLYPAMGHREPEPPQFPIRHAGDPNSPGGLRGEYYNNRELNGAPQFTRIDSHLDFSWAGGSPAPGIPADYFGARWTGQIQPRFSERYVFTGHRDNSFRLWVDGKLIVDLWNNDWGAYESRPIQLQANRRYDIRVEFSEENGDAGLTLKWKSQNQREEIVPPSVLYPAAGNFSNFNRPKHPPEQPPTPPPPPPPPQANLDRKLWYATRGSWNDRFGDGRAYDATGISTSDDEITLNADRRDQVGALYYKPIAVPRGSILVIKRQVFVHAANRKFEGCLTAYGVSDESLSAVKPAYEQAVFNIGYKNFDYETDQNLFALSDGRSHPRGPGKFASGTAPSTSPLWDQWFSEEIRYNSRSGETIYLINGQERMRYMAQALDQPYIKLLLHSYGWNTGHYTKMRGFQVSVEPGRMPEFRPRGDLRVRLLLQPYSWSDNGNNIGTIVFASDGTARASWSGDIHYWKIESDGELVVHARGQTYVVRLRADREEGTLVGERDRASQVRNGVRIVLRPIRR